MDDSTMDLDSIELKRLQVCVSIAVGQLQAHKIKVSVAKAHKALAKAQSRLERLQLEGSWNYHYCEMIEKA